MIPRRIRCSRPCTGNNKEKVTMTTKMFNDLDILELEAFLNESDRSAGEDEGPSAAEDDADTSDAEDNAGSSDAEDDADTQPPAAAGGDAGEDTHSAEDSAAADEADTETVNAEENVTAAAVPESEDEEEVDFLPELEELTEIGRTAAEPAAPAAQASSSGHFAGRRGNRSGSRASGRVSRPRRRKKPAGTPGRPSVPLRETQEKSPFPLHLALLAAIAAVILIAIVRLLLWNRGTELKVHSGQNSGKYIIEVNDNMVYLPDSKLEGHTDDGVTTILCLGNEPFSQDTSGTGLAGQIASLGNVDVINAAFPGSQVTCENAQYSVESLDTMDDIFNLFYVSYAISIGDFSSLETVASAHTEDDTYQRSVDALKNTDFDKVDIIAVMYDGADYINGMAMQNPDVPEELTTYVGSLTNSFQLLQAAYPYIRIVFLSPYYAEYNGASGRTTDIGNGTLVNYFQWAYDTCGSCSVSFLDNYYGSVNENNYAEYLSDGIHLNAAGATKVADHFVYKVVEDQYAEYDVSDLAVAGK